LIHDARNIEHKIYKFLNTTNVVSKKLFTFFLVITGILIFYICVQ
jgi:hypothetical protein